jgi:uncharacterized protein YndB with AHSA1/START domain
METFTNTVKIDRPVEQVFSFLADLENVPRWNYAIEETRKATPGPVGVGTEYRQVRSLPRRSEERLEVTELEPDRRLVVAGTLGPFPATVSYELDASGGGTRVVNEVRLEMRGPIRLVGGIAAARVKDAVARNLGELKRLLETGD